MSPWPPIKACAVSFWWEQWLLWVFIWQFIQSLCAHIKLQGDSEQLNCFNFVCLCLCVCSGAQALILDICMLVPAGLTTGADDCVPLYSLLFIYYFIYNLSTNTFRPMGALWIHLDIIKKSARGSFTNLITCWWLDEDGLNKWLMGLWSAIIKLNCDHDCLCEGCSMWAFSPAMNSCCIYLNWPWTDLEERREKKML